MHNNSNDLLQPKVHNHYFGVVEDIDDPDKLGRVKVRIIGIHSELKTDIKTEDLWWSYVVTPATSPAISGLGNSPFLVQGSNVLCISIDPNEQHFLVIGSIPTMALEDTRINSKGFKDPSRVYPRNPGTPDLNMRARGQFPIIDPKSKGVLEPERIVFPEYPNNHVFETKKGHIKEYDDSDMAPRIHEKHSSGTYYEIGPGGSKVTKVVADNYTLVMGNDTLEVWGSVNIVANGNINLACSGDLDANVDGNITVNGEGHTSIKLGGFLNIKAGSDIKIEALDDITLVAAGTVTIKEDSLFYCSIGDIDEHTTQSDCTAAGGTWKSIKATDDDSNLGIIIDAISNIKIRGDSKIDITAEKDITISSLEGDMKFSTPNGDIHFNQNE